MLYTIYKTTNIINGKIYIGKHQTISLNDDYIGSGKYLLRAVDKYGYWNFVKDILFVFDNEQDMNNKEKELVTEEFCSLNTNYNICAGGKGGFSYINNNGLRGGRWTSNIKSNAVKNWLLKNNQEWTKKYKKSLSKGHYKYYETHNGTFKDKKHTEQTKEKMRISQLGKQTGNLNSQYGTCWVYKDKNNMKIKKKELELYLEQGYIKGRKMAL